MGEKNIMIKATIIWVRESEGGKRIIPEINEKYYPIFKIKGHDEIFSWSFVVVNLEKTSDLTTVAQVYFLMDDAPSNVLVKNLEFSLFEGRLVAEGKIH